MPTMLDTTLVRTPGVCGGRLRIDGTRMTVNQIVTLYKQGLTAPQIIERYPQRTLSEIYTVFAWYHAHQAELDRELAEEEASVQQSVTELATTPVHRTWYAARIAFQCLVGENDTGPWTVDEQIRVIEAGTHEQAYDKAVRLGQQEETEYLNPYGDRVRWVFLGVSELEEVMADRIEDGTQITYLWHETYDLTGFMRDRSETIVFWQEENKHLRTCDILGDESDTEDAEDYE